MKKTHTLIIAAVLVATNLFAQPTRNWGTYYGGSLDEAGNTQANGYTDASGNVYLVGTTNSTNGISTPGSHQPNIGGNYDAFLVKFNSAGVRQWATYYGGPDGDMGGSVVVDASGNVFLIGETESAAGISTPGCYQPNWAGAFQAWDAFIVKFNSSGVRQWATYYGGDGDEMRPHAAIDNSGNLIIGGQTGSPSGIATVGAHQVVRDGPLDGFVAKFNTAGAIQWATFYGGPANDEGINVAADASGNIYFCGTSGSSSSVATAGCHQPVYGGAFDAFLVKFNASGVRQWGTYLGGNGWDEAHDVAVDANGDVYITGFTQSGTGISTAGCHQLAYGGVRDAILQKFNSAGVRQWGTYYGGTGLERGASIEVGAGGQIYFGGHTDSPNAISTVGSHQPALSGLYDAYWVQFNASGVRQCATYYGGPDDEFGCSLSSDASGNVTMTGKTYSLTGISTPGSHQPNFGGGLYDGFLVQLIGGGGGGGGTTVTTGIISPAINCAGATVSVPFTITGTYVAGNTFTAELSNSLGSFASPVIIGTLVGVNAGTITAVIPANTSPSGSGYKIRVTASNPITTGSSSSVTINALPVVTISGAAASYCINGADVTLTGNPGGGTFSGNGMVGNIFTPATAGLGSHTITYSYTDANGCAGVATQNINVNAIPTVSFSGLNNAYILADPTVTMTGVPAGGVFSGPGVTGSKFSPSGAGIGTHNIVYIYSDGNGCMNAICQSVTITLINQLENHKMGNNDEISVYPNPSSGRYTLTFDGQNQPIKIRVMNAVGQIIYEENHEQYKGIYNKIIDLGKFANGIYSLSVEMNGQTFQKSIVKQ